MIEKTNYQAKRQQGKLRSSLTRSIDEIAIIAGTDRESVLKAVSDLGISASNGGSFLSVQDAGKIHAHLLPAPEIPRTKVPKGTKPYLVDIPQRGSDVPDPNKKAETWIPLRNPIHRKRDDVPSNRRKQRPPMTFASPEPIPTGALIPPKTLIAHTRISSKEPEEVSPAKEQIMASVHRGDEPTGRMGDPILEFQMPVIDPFDLSFTKPLLDLLQDFSPGDYGRLFLYLGSAIELDLQARSSILEKQPAVFQGLLSNTTELKFLQRVCSYKYGIFGYKESTRLLARDARQRTSKNLSETVEAVCRLRPMVRGLMTDEAGQRFIAWNVDPEIKRIQTVAFEDLERWIRGLLAGRYVRLKTILIDVDKPASDDEWETLNFMAEAAENLRSSVHFFKQRQNPTRAHRSRRELSPTSQNAHLGTRVTIRDHSRFLVPIFVEGTREIRFGLREDFFDDMAVAPVKHEVRDFMRRAPGTPYDAPKTVPVASHTRGGTIFDDARKTMPTVAIIRPKRQLKI